MHKSWRSFHWKLVHQDPESGASVSFCDPHPTLYPLFCLHTDTLEFWSIPLFTLEIHHELEIEISASLFWIQKISVYICVHVCGGVMYVHAGDCAHVCGHQKKTLCPSSTGAVNFLLKPWTPWHGWASWPLGRRILSVSISSVQLDINAGSGGETHISCFCHERFT